MKIYTIPVGPLQTNCYIVSNDEQRCVIIDPGDEAQKIIEFIESKNLKPTGILLTHSHFDHIGALSQIKEFTTCDVVNSVDFLETVETPGHTPDSVCFVSEEHKVIFSGDTLFNQGIGRTDLEGGDYEQIKKSLKLLVTYSDDYKVYPGHGPETTIGDEKVAIDKITE